jgi:transcription elongation factor Elf1
MTNKASNAPAPQGSGFHCPRCQALISVTLQELLHSPNVICSVCSLELTLDPLRSAEALKELRKLAAGTDEARRLLDQAGTTQPGRD